MSSNIARGDISRTGIINYFLPLLRALLECGFYSREGLIWGNTVYNLDIVKAENCDWRKFDDNITSGPKTTSGISSLSFDFNPICIFQSYILEMET